jgi:formate hydrogenlyase subunit 3/multisubunit Na+/H+ antiporter MnhD subunit
MNEVFVARVVMSVSSGALILWALLPLAVGIVLQLLAAKFLSSRAKGVLALLCSLPSLAAVVSAFVRIHATGAAIEWNATGWDGPLALVFHVDSLSLMFAAMGAVLGAIVLLYSIGYMAHDKAATRFYCFMLTFILGMIGLVYSANLFALYLCWEMMGLCSFSLVGFWYDKPQSVAGARKVLLMTHLAGYGLLAAILLIFARTGSALWTDPAVAQAFTTGVYVLMLVALLAKSVQFPLHTWIPEAMNAPTPVSALLHAACYVKAGVYLAARMHGFAPWHASWCLTMMWLGTVTMVVGVAYAMVQHDLKRMLAFHTVSQIGYIITGVGLGTPLGIVAGLLHCLNHSLFKGGLFLAAGSVQHATGTRDMNELGGLSRRMPHTTTTWLISVGAMMGIPFMSGFASKWLLYTAALQAGQVVPALLAWIVSVGTVFSCVKATSAVFLGPTSPATAEAHESPASMVWALRLFALGSVILGLAPQLAVNYILNPILPLFGMATVQVSWFGLTPAAGSWWTTGGLILAVVSAVAGVILYMFAGMSRARVAAVSGIGSDGSAVLSAGGGVGTFTGGEPMAGSGRMPASDFSVILRKAWAPLYAATDVDRVYLGFWHVLEAIAGATKGLVGLLERYAVVTMVVFTAALTAVLANLAPALPTVHEGAASMPVLLAVACGLALFALLVASAANKAWQKLLPLLALSGAAAVGAILVAESLLRTGLLELASVLALLLIWRAGSKRATVLYLAVVVLSAVAICGGQYGLATGAAWGGALLLAGFVLKLAVVPAFFWLSAVAEAVPALVLGLVIAVVDMAAFGELYLTASAQPTLFEPRGLWIGLALASSLLGALLMIAQRDIKRMLAYSTIEDMGFLFLGLVAANELGTTGALLGAAAHAVAKTLLFVSISSAEADGNLGNGLKGLAQRYPVSAAGFMAGMLAMLGVPPMVGFAGRWRLYSTASNLNHGLLAGFIASSMLALVAYVLCLTRVWWGPASDELAAKPAAEPWAVRIVIVLLIVALLAGGICPNALLALAGGIQ